MAAALTVAEPVTLKYPELSKLFGDLLDARFPPPAPAAPDLVAPLSAKHPWLAKFHQDIQALPKPPTATDVLVFSPDGSAALKTKAGLLLETRIAMAQRSLLGGLEASLPTFWGVPIASLAIGGLGGLLVGDLIDSFQPPKDAAGKLNFINIAVKAGAAFAIATVGGRFISGTASMFAVGILGLQILADLLPLDEWMSTVIRWFKRTPPANIGTLRQPMAAPEYSANGASVPQHQVGAGRHDLLVGVL